MAMCLAFPLVANAIDHPVDHAILGIAIPVPDARYFISGGVCAAASHGVATPIDVVKTRIQANPAEFDGMGLLGATQSILDQDGPSALLGGLGPTVVGYGLEGAVKFGLYESFKPIFASLLHLDSDTVPFLAASIVAGAAASFMLLPLERTRVRIVTDPTFKPDGLVS
jgi:solute carrier family 25 phosphate transporter 3